MGYFGSGRQTDLLALVALALIGGWSTCAWAVNRDYTITMATSSVTVSGTVDTAFGSSDINSQGAGAFGTSLVSRYTGTIKTQRDADTITFVTGSSIDASVSGNWAPKANATAGTEAADYGGRSSFAFGLATVNFAGRNFVGGLTSDTLTIDGSDHFPLSTTDLRFSNGSIAYLASGLSTASGTQTVVNRGGLLTGNGTLSILVQGAQTTETLTVPIDSTFQIVDPSATINLTLAGSLVATSTFATPLPGDYNQNGVVDAADYVRYRNNFGSGTSLPNDDSAGVGTDDYTRWRTNFGQSYGSGSGESLQSGSSVPEASSVMLLLTAATAGSIRYRRPIMR